MLLIEDLFKSKISESDINIVFELVNYRYFNNLPVIVSCEKCINDIIEIDEAIGSRLIEMGKSYLIKIIGRKINYRMKTK